MFAEVLSILLVKSFLSPVRFVRRIKEWKLHPGAELRKKLLRDEAWVVQRWPELAEHAVAWNETALESKVQQFLHERCAAEKATRLRDITISDLKTFAWLKRPHATESCSHCENQLPLEPADQVDFLKQQWCQLWLQAPMNNLEDITGLAQSKPEFDLKLPNAVSL